MRMKLIDYFKSINFGPESRFTYIDEIQVPDIYTGKIGEKTYTAKKENGEFKLLKLGRIEIFNNSYYNRMASNDKLNALDNNLKYDDPEFKALHSINVSFEQLYGDLNDIAIFKETIGVNLEPLDFRPTNSFGHSSLDLNIDNFSDPEKDHAVSFILYDDDYNQYHIRMGSLIEVVTSKLVKNEVKTQDIEINEMPQAVKNKRNEEAQLRIKNSIALLNNNLSANGTDLSSIITTIDTNLEQEKIEDEELKAFILEQEQKDAASTDFMKQFEEGAVPEVSNKKTLTLEEISIMFDNGEITPEKAIELVNENSNSLSKDVVDVEISAEGEVAKIDSAANYIAEVTENVNLDIETPTILNKNLPVVAESSVVKTEDKLMGQKQSEGKLLVEIDWMFVQDIAERMREGKLDENGNLKYHPYNWQDPNMDVQKLREANDRHWLKYKMGLQDEDHMMAIVTNMMMIRYHERKHGCK